MRVINWSVKYMLYLFVIHNDLWQYIVIFEKKQTLSICLLSTLILMMDRNRKCQFVFFILIKIIVLHRWGNGTILYKKQNLYLKRKIALTHNWNRIFRRNDLLIRYKTGYISLSIIYFIYIISRWNLYFALFFYFLRCLVTLMLLPLLNVSVFLF